MDSMCVGVWGRVGGDNSGGVSQGLALLSLDDENERCVALWLKSINLDEYRHKIIDYGYDSMRALDMANEEDVVAMTEDASIGMKKPHRTLLIKEWKARAQAGSGTAATLPPPPLPAAAPSAPPPAAPPPAAAASGAQAPPPPAYSGGGQAPPPPYSGGAQAAPPPYSGAAPPAYAGGAQAAPPAYSGAAPPAYGGSASAPPPPYNPAAGGYSKKDPWTNFEWRQMPPPCQQNWLTLGYTPEMWDGSREPASISKEFGRLTPAEQRAASALGYSQHMWDNDLHPDPLPTYVGGAQTDPSAPPGCFKCLLPLGVSPGQTMEVAVPAGYPQAGRISRFVVPATATPGSYVFAPLP